MFRTQAAIYIFLAIVLVAPVACQSDDAPEPPPPTAKSAETAPSTERVVGPLTPQDSQALATMTERIKQYLELHDQVEQSLPSRPTEATPEQIDAHQRAFEQAMRGARATAKPGDIFTPEAQPVIRRLMAQVFGGPDGKSLKSSIMDENPANPVALNVTINSRYPDTVPLTTIPPQVLQALPELTQDLEYRFIGDWLILLDVEAHIVADFMKDVLPK
jgi:hypothetical protein